MAYKDPEKDRAYTRERYHWLKEHGICVACATNYNEPGHVYCAECRKKQIRSHSTEKMIKGRAQRAREKRHERIMNGLCGDCGSPVIDGFINCARCREKRRDAELRARIHRKMKMEDKENGKTE